MRVYKVICLSVLLMGSVSCKETVSKQEYDEIMVEYKLLKESLDATQESNLQQAATINKALSELAEISGNTLILRNDIENGIAKVKQADRISANIHAIKYRILQLENQIGDDTAYKKIVQNLKTIITEKEAEIESLKKIIDNQSDTINEQRLTIDNQQLKITNQQEKISNQQEQLTFAVVRQAQLLYQAAKEFEQFALDVPDVTRKKNQKKNNEWALSMYSRSLLYYQKSQEYGIDATKDIDRVKNRMTKLSKD